MKTFKPGDVIRAEEMNANFTELNTKINTTARKTHSFSLNSTFTGSTLTLTQVGAAITLEGIARQGAGNTPLEPGREYTIGTVPTAARPQRAIHGDTYAAGCVSYVAGSGTPHSADAILTIDTNSGTAKLRVARRTSWVHITAVWSIS